MSPSLASLVVLVGLHAPMAQMGVQDTAVVPTGGAWPGPGGSDVGGGGDSPASGALSDTGNAGETGVPSESSAVATRELGYLRKQSYAATLITVSQALAVNPASMAAIASAESRFQNVPGANAAVLAPGPWHMTRSMFLEISEMNGLGYRAADVGNPEAQAEVAPYYAQQIAAVIAAASGHPATTLEVYAGWVFGPDAGMQMVSQSDGAPLGTLVSAITLRNRGMIGWTVGEFREAMTPWLGAAANQTVLTSPGIEQSSQ
jgi:hypothetical protein